MDKLFTKKTTAIFWNNNKKAIQRMLDYDYLIDRKTPSVSAIVAPTSNNKFEKFFFGSSEIIINVYNSTTKAAKNHKDASVLINFASFRSSYDVAMDAMNIDQIKTMMITAEGIPERFSRMMAQYALQKEKLVIGPATVGAITAGAFKTANISGTIENIISSKLYRAGSCGLITRSGGLFNELSNIIAKNADGIAEGVAIGGDRYTSSTFLDIALRMEKNPDIKYIILLGEVGGKEEYKIIDAIKNKKITKPVIAWCIGTIAKLFQTDVQFGHAGASANNEKETAEYKNNAMRKAGINVPNGFNDFPRIIAKIYKSLLDKSIIKKIKEVKLNTIPKDYTDIMKKDEVRKSKNFICTISDDRGEEATYGKHTISSLATPNTNKSIGDVISLLWFKKIYPKWATNYIETILKTVADHGPAVSGAITSKIVARAGKDNVSSLVAGLLSIGPRFGGAIDGSAKYFRYGKRNKLTPKEFISYMKKQGIPIPGIGHRIKSAKNPDKRVEILKKYAIDNFKYTKLLKYALEIEKLTLSKKENLILNVDGAIGILTVDMWYSLDYKDEQIDEFIESGVLNSFFILGRTIGILGHILDEKRLKMPMYRHPFDDILYSLE